MKRRILLVDDELAILLTLRAILEMNGFEVDTAASSKEAQHKLKSGVYEMVITDMRMETETAGYDVIRAARQQPYDPATALLTAYPSLGNEWKSNGVHSLLVKPVNTNELLRQLEEGGEVRGTLRAARLRAQPICIQGLRQNLLETL